jgi:uncharacterized protein
MTPILIIPGWGNSGPQHWQSLWEQLHPEYRRVMQREWEMPDRDAWVTTLHAAITAAPAPPILVAHSLGCIAIAQWWADHALDLADYVAGAMLVAPADVEAVMAPEAVQGFCPIPLVPFLFPSVVVASRTDDYVSFERAAAFSAAWGNELVDIGDAGHINTDAGYGPWPAGELILRDLLVRVA